MHSRKPKRKGLTMSDHSLGLYLLNTKLASLKGTLERVSSEILAYDRAMLHDYIHEKHVLLWVLHK